MNKSENPKKRYMHYFCKEIIQNKLCRDRMHMKVIPQKFAYIKLQDMTSYNEIIASYILQNEPFALIRPGTGEINDAVIWEEKELFGRPLYTRKPHNQMPLHSYLEEKMYQEMLRKDLADADIVAAFIGMPFEEYLVEQYAPKAKIIDYQAIEPINAGKPWTLALENKKVLFVTPFADYILEQYQKIDQIYNGKKLLPKFEIKVLKSIWYVKGETSGFNSWFDALNYLYDEAMKIDFDIAILSCGAFAIDLAPMLKRAGKSAIQYGGALQMLFGILGSRWENCIAYKNYFDGNSAWIRPSMKEMNIASVVAGKVDDGCYW